MQSYRIVDPGGNGREVDEMFAWVVVHSPGNEAIAGVDGLPLVAHKRETALNAKPLARIMADKCGKPLKLVRLRRAEVIEEIQPGQG